MRGYCSRMARRGRTIAAPQRGTMLATIIDDIGNLLRDVVHWFQTLTPGGFGLILIPLGILGVISILVSRKN